MSQSHSQQTTIDQFYKVVSSKKTGFGISSQSSQKKSIQRKSRLTIKSRKMSPVVKSEVQIIGEINNKQNVSINTSEKRSPLLVLENSSKKLKTDVTTIANSNSSINKTPQKIDIPSPKASSEQKRRFVPKTPSRITQSLSATKLFFKDRINMYTVNQALENLNFVRDGIINQKEFYLDEIYQNKKYQFVYSRIIVSSPEKYELSDIVFPQEKHADHLLMAVMEVFSNPANCCYFLKSELETIFLLFTLSAKSQMLFVRLLKRKLSWHRTKSIEYPEIADDLDPFFIELLIHKFCDSDIDTTDISVLVHLLQVDELRSICQKLKIDHKGNKAALINKLLKFGNYSKTFFLGAKSPKLILRSNVLSTLQACVCLPENIISLFDRVLTLLHPIQDPAESTADLFLIFTSVHGGDLSYPYQLRHDFFPIFCNRTHLIEFVKSKRALKEIVAATERKDWGAVRSLGETALNYVKKSQKDESSSIPLYVQKFVPAYTWIKVLSKSIDAFKKSPETIPNAVNILKTLIEEKRFFQNRRGQWYSELALIEMHHRKDLETSAALTIHALEKESLTEVDVSELLERLKKLLRRKNGISNETKKQIQRVHQNIEQKGLTPQPATTKTITANMANRIEAGGKSTWSVTTDGNDKYYGSVEMLALQHYTSNEDFHTGLHCEGALPVTLFAVFFWDELYNFFVPGTFVSPYQYAPLDLFTAEFFNNRKSSIEDRLSRMRELDLESFTEWMHGRYRSNRHYKSVIANALFKDDQQFKEVVNCLGINGVVGICERLVSNFRLWRSGFPDLVVWNASIPKCKIVEVKGPGDSLSEKQKLWLQYLEQLGIAVEVCHVQAIGRGSK